LRVIDGRCRDRGRRVARRVLCRRAALRAPFANFTSPQDSRPCRPADRRRGRCGLSQPGARSCSAWGKGGRPPASGLMAFCTQEDRHCAEGLDRPVAAAGARAKWEGPLRWPFAL